MSILLITTAYQRCLTSPAVSDKRIPEWLSVICSLQNWGLVCWEATSGVKSQTWPPNRPESCVTAAWCSCTCVMHWKAKVTSSLTDVWLWQQLFGAYHCDVWLFIHSHPCMAAWKPHQCTNFWRVETPITETGTKNMFIRNQWGTSMSWSSIWLKRGQQPAELHWSSDWSVARLF